MAFKEKVSHSNYINLAPLPFVAIAMFTQNNLWFYIGVPVAIFTGILIYTKPTKSEIGKGLMQTLFIYLIFYILMLVIKTILN